MIGNMLASQCSTRDRAKERGLGPSGGDERLRLATVSLRGLGGFW